MPVQDRTDEWRSENLCFTIFIDTTIKTRNPLVYSKVTLIHRVRRRKQLFLVYNCTKKHITDIQGCT